MCGKSDKILVTLKKRLCLGVLERGERGDDNATGLKVGGGIEMSYKCQSTVVSIYAIARSLFAFCIFTYVLIFFVNFDLKKLGLLPIAIDSILF